MKLIRPRSRVTQNLVSYVLDAQAVGIRFKTSIGACEAIQLDSLNDALSSVFQTVGLFGPFM